MRWFGSRPALFTSLLLTAALAVGCGGGSGSQSAGGDGLEKKTVTVAALPLLDSAGLYIAQQRKFFQAEGLTVKIQPVAQSLLALPELQNGQVDVVSGGSYVTFLQANDNGTLQLRVLSDAASEAPRFMGALVAKNSPIKAPQGFAGKTIAVNVSNNIQSLTFNEVLRANNVDPATVHYVQIPFPQMAAALQQHKVDAVHTTEPFGTVIQRKLGAEMIIDAGATPVTDLPVSGYLSTQDFVSRYPKTAAAFQRAIEKAQQIAATDPMAVEQVLPTYAKIDAQTASVVGLPGYPASANPMRLERLIGLMQRAGMLKNKTNPDTVIFAPSSK